MVVCHFGMTQDEEICGNLVIADSRLKPVPVGIPKCQLHYNMLFYTFWSVRTRSLPNPNRNDESASHRFW